MRLSVAIAMLLAAPLAAQELPNAIKAVIDKPEYKHARWGILIADSKTGDTIYSRNADTFFAPASVTKLYSCAAALVALGPDHRFETPVFALGKIEGGELAGDLVLVAQGDLTFGSRAGKDGKTLFRNNDHIYIEGIVPTGELTDSNPVGAYDELAKQVKAAGIASVSGDVLIDDRLFALSEGSGSGPRIVSPIISNDNLIDLIITPGQKPGDPAKITTRPETAYLNADFDVTTIPSDGPKALRENASFTAHSLDPREFSLRGRIPVASGPLIGILPIHQPADFARTLFIEALRRQGVHVHAPLVKHQFPIELPKGKAYENLKPVAKFTSRPLEEAIEVTLKVSHNLYASTLPQLIAAKKGKGKSVFDGLRAEGEVLKEIGVDLEAVSFAGGAGGANADHVTPRATVGLLRAMAKRPEWKAYKHAMPVLGVDGTLAASVEPESSTKGKVFAKTGTLVWGDPLNGRMYLTSKTLAGVMTTKNGTELTIALFVNDVPLPSGVKVSREGKVLGNLCEIIYEKGP